ncbi:unnamed protein product [Linum trigynum]|uniref:Uncharacterized protein n=1 Tax=Linum trigynum TaxID=586398 RepID=A0AAV2FTA3_9ROSI
MGAACIREWLDRDLFSQNWLESFPDTLLKHFTDQGFDHRVIILSDKPYVRNSRPLFCFDARWADNPEVKAMVTYVWAEEVSGNPTYQLWEKLKKLRHLLYDWSRAGTTNSLRNIKTLQAEIDRVKLCRPINWEEVRVLETELNKQWEAEEANFVAGLHNEEGEWVTEEKGRVDIAKIFLSTPLYLRDPGPEHGSQD